MNLRRAAFPEVAPADIREKVEANEEANAVHRKHMMIRTRMARFGGAPGPQPSLSPSSAAPGPQPSLSPSSAAPVPPPCATSSAAPVLFVEDPVPESSEEEDPAGTYKYKELLKNAVDINGHDIVQVIVRFVEI